MRQWIVGPVVLAAALWVGNTSLFTRFPAGSEPKIIAHRGAYQTFDKAGLDSQGCTATRIGKPEHPYLENTIPSMQAAFEAGADVVELDIHLTPDKQFAVFHDWTLDCRTDGKGVTEETPMAALRALDLGHGYTFDGGRSFPFRGKGIGMMPTLPEVLDALPEGRFLVNFKSRRVEEGEALARLIDANPHYRERIMGVYGGGEPTEVAMAGIAGLTGFSNASAKACLLEYFALGWSSYVPEACRGRLVAVPANYAFLLWGWPARFNERLRAHGSEIVLMGDYAAGDVGTSGIDDAAAKARLPKDFPGYVWTNAILDWKSWPAEPPHPNNF